MPGRGWRGARGACRDITEARLRGMELAQARLRERARQATDLVGAGARYGALDLISIGTTADVPAPTDITTIDRAVMMIGVTPFFAKFENLPLVEDSLKDQPQALIGLLRVMFDPRTTLQQQVSEQLQTHFGDKVFNTVIPRNVRLAEAPSYGLPGVVFDPSSKGAQSFVEFAKEMVRRIAAM